VDGTSACTVSSASLDEYAELPREYVDTTYSLPGGSVYTVKSSGGDYTSLQTALNDAATNTIKVVVVDSGMTFTGPITYPNKTWNDWTYIISSDVYDSTFPRSATERVVAADVTDMYKIQTNGSNGVAIDFASGASKYRTVGCEIVPVGTNTVTLVDQSSTTNEDIHFDRCYMHGTPGSVGLRRAIRFEGRRCAVINSRITGCRDSNDSDSQAVWGLGAKVVKVYNNYLEAASENIMLGGSCTSDLCEDWWIAKNHMPKDNAWEGLYPVKNLFELKAGRRILFEDNVLENCWVSGQDGTAFLFKSVSPAGCGDGPQYVVEDVVVRYNKIRNCEEWMRMTPTYKDSTQQMQRITFKHNLFITPRNAGSYWIGHFNDGLGQRTNEVVMIHNTFICTLTYWPFGWNSNTVGTAETFKFNDNIIQSGANYGPFSGNYAGMQSKFTVTAECERNGLIRTSTVGSYPASNINGSTTLSVHFTDTGSEDYSVKGTSPFSGIAESGTDAGVDFTTLTSRLSGVE